MSNDAFLAQVAVAFPAEPRPSAAAMLKTHCDECIAVSNAFGGRPWPEISVDDLVAGETALLSAAAWCYYLPAMIVWCVQRPDATEGLVDNLAFQLAPPEPGEEDAWFAERSGAFSEPQRHAIVAFLHWYIGAQDVEYAALEMEPPAHAHRALAYWTVR